MTQHAKDFSIAIITTCLQQNRACLLLVNNGLGSRTVRIVRVMILGQYCHVILSRSLVIHQKFYSDFLSCSFLFNTVNQRKNRGDFQSVCSDLHHRSLVS